MKATNSKRRWAREPVSCEAELRRGDDLLVGTVLDMSEGGVFFRPEAGVIDGFFTQLEDHSGWPAVGTTVTFHEPARWPEMPVTVRWGGHSESHRCRGLGLELEG